jgi:quinoprotein glucose dehydrogenase
VGRSFARNRLPNPPARKVTYTIPHAILPSVSYGDPDHMRLRLLSLAALVAGPLLTPARTAAQPPVPPPEFAEPQSPPKPEPFPVKLVDQGQFDPMFKGYFLPEGFRMEVVIDAPDTINPVGMTFAPDGSLFVLEWGPDPVTGGRWFEVQETFRYKDGTTRQVATMKKFTMDVVKHFPYDPATGKFGPPKVIIAEELPSSVLYHDGWLYVTGRGTVRRWKQSRPGGPWDIRETIAQGFCGFHHHQVSGLTIGNDGYLYLTSGDDDNFAEGSDGSRATVLRTGAVFRCKPDGSKLEAYSLGYRNPYRDLAYDNRFNWFHTDNDNEDGSRFMGCRIMHVAEGADFGWRLFLGARCCRPDHVRGAVAGELPGKMPPMIKTGRGAPAGLLIYHDTRLPEHYRGLLYYPDVFRKLVRAYKVAPAGSTFQITHELEFLKSDDPLFRPCQMVTGPDGAIYVCDWRTDSGGAGKLSGDGLHGRVYRITWAGTNDHPALPRRGMDSWAKVLRLDDEKLVDALASPDLTDRVEARKELVRRGPKSRDLVLRRLVSGKLPEQARLVALGVLQAHWGPEVEDLFRLLLNDESADVRRLVAEGLGVNAQPEDRRVFDALLKALADRDPAVRRAGALAIGRLRHPGAADALVGALRFDDQADVYLKDAYLRGLERLGKPGIDALVALADAGDKQTDLAVQAFLTLRTEPAAAALPQLLWNPKVSAAQREALVRSYSNYQFDPPVSLDPLADYLTRRPNEPIGVTLAAVEVFAASGDLNSPKAVALVLGLLNRPDAAVRLAAIKAVEDARVVAAAPALIGFLADQNRAPAEREAVAKALQMLNDRRAVLPLRAVLGSDAPATLKAEALRALTALDPAQARIEAQKLLDEPDRAVLAEAVTALGTTKPGARLIAERYLAEKLPRDFFPQVTEALKRFENDPALDKLRAEVMRGGLLVSLEPGQIEKVRQLVASRGDPKRGKDIYLNTKVLACATCHRMEGVGGNTGPDLTRVWDTMSVDKLLESIVDPSREIKEGYQTYRVVTAAGQVLTGLKVSETDKEVVLRDANGRDTRVDKEDVEQLGPTKLSLMPDNAVSQLTYDQFIDLLAFLKSRTEQESLRGMVLEFAVAGPFSSNLGSSRPEVTASTKGPAWRTVFAEAGGLVDLKSAFPSGPAPAGVYARAYVYSPKRQTVTGVVRAENPLRVWVGNVSVFEQPAAAVATEQAFRADLDEGWNVVLVKVVNTAKSHRLGLRFAGDGLRTATAPEAIAAGATNGGQ